MGVRGLGGVEGMALSLVRKGEEEYGLALSLDGLGEGEFRRWLSRPMSVDAEGSLGCRPRGELEPETKFEQDCSASKRCETDPMLWG